jgi:hypothetical protein
MTDVMTRTRVDPLAAENAHLLNGQGYLLLLDDREMIGSLTAALRPGSALGIRHATPGSSGTTARPSSAGVIDYRLSTAIVRLAKLRRSAITVTK